MILKNRPLTANVKGRKAIKWEAWNVKKLLSLLCVIGMLLGMGVPVHAETGGTTLTIGNLVADAGEEIEVPIRISNNTGILGATITITYAEELTLTKIQKGDALTSLTMTKPGKLSANPINIVWDGESDADVSNGTIAILTFTAPKVNGKYSITISYKSGAVIDADLKPVSLNIENGTVEVQNGVHIHTLVAHTVKNATCTENGNGAYWSCSGCDKLFSDADAVNEIKEIPEIKATGHKTQLQNMKNATCTAEGYTGDEVCTVCGQTVKKGENIGKVAHSYNDGVVTMEPTCEKEGVKTYTCTVCGDSYTESIAKVAHKTELKNAKEATCTETGATGDEVCTVCGATIKASEVIPAKGHKTETNGYVAPTCTESGWTGTGVCTVCGETVSENTEIPALGHTPEAVAGKDATCTESGLTDGSKCAVCGTVLTEQKVIPPKGHTPEAVAGKEATCTESGLTDGSKCAVCGTVLTEQKTIAALGHCFTHYVYNNDAKAGVDGTETAKCDRCGVTDTRTAAGTALPKVSFTDVPAGKYYTDAVSWAVENEITNGTTATTFSPDNACNRGQIVVFLWRMAGKPIAQNRNNPFTDVKEGSFCYEAVLWAAEQGITTGKTATTFCPAETCNRGQIVTFLWRYAGKPAPQNQNRQFVDVAAGSFCDQAVMWAVENQITLGVDATHFNPTGKCTRGHAVTFLYRGRELLKK